MNLVTVTYTYVYELDFAPEYVFTKCKKCINAKRNKELKQVIKGGCIGYNIRGKFYSLKKLKPHLIKPKKERLPF